MGRFISSDVYISTGQGFVGNNMFAYCGNHPVSRADSSGRAYKGLLDQSDCMLAVMALGAAGIFANPKVRDKIIDEANKTIEVAKKEVYEYSQDLRQELAEVAPSMPQVHHIVPVGDFSSRNAATAMQIQEMHNLLSSAGINRYTDVMNLTLVSGRTHAQLHTDSYIAHVHSYIMSTDGSKQQIYEALFWLRLEIAAKDGFAVGY